MASAVRLHLSSLIISHSLLPRLSLRLRPPPPSTSGRLRRFSLTLPSAPSAVRHEPPSLPVRAQAKRGFSSKDGDLASADDIQFEAPLKIVEYPDPALRAKNKRIGTFDDNLKKLVDEMFDVMYKTDGIGLSAPQVGINVQLMVFNPVGESGEGEEIVLVNPRIIKYSKKMVPFNEGCLSFPGIYADVQRPESVKIDALDISGARFTVSLSGLPARVFQHEFDHLQGIVFSDRMTEQVLDSIHAELEALEKKYEQRTGLPSPERIDTRRRRVAIGFGKS
ncbi:peptide deformylase 1B, chloroplastic/mitochondrial-like [Rhodamnia argentea]|uniref:Peptide deformylase n=1 Tax=Rhodamnia argentea TaxID=178133 RepID=A0A8B8QDW3_9MYRT|nr:peptide deformylase 1B, chloroplastic/mitochondrial [Rhodamnia argentea]XP_030544733.1 peptide deformylase 1B, chloroplastic/mitochondrial [Rhodamnia argentea]XP_030544734.1 peptide deformylase 1B, chloroplastic/mitochondrial [Rhodamnia argentea]XP_048128799.1 peptide deformylase 1B, chloroplastic/mitochondrial-like [Rhodamnia argentea]XP_048128800.1 peptide deformylase 1B, chloroplastic/mitochondrial-like [Rhodamnia argentea]XP_048128801.1 peptide deformylase 1B, chloroplastic/mitochondria